MVLSAYLKCSSLSHHYFLIKDNLSGHHQTQLSSDISNCSSDRELRLVTDTPQLESTGSSVLHCFPLLPLNTF